LGKGLKDLLLEIELCLKTEKWEEALSLYHQISENWEALSSRFTLEELQEVLKIAEFLHGLLKEKVASLKKEERHLLVKKNYSKYL